MPQPHCMQERAAADWRTLDSASIEWLPVAVDSTCSGWRINVFNLKPATYQPLQTFPPACGSAFPDHFYWRRYLTHSPA
ncbi:hypothetical protein DL122_09180 [Salmonella enterica subsp. salamae]|nr:hypothetical protein [Salmonella enterica subsp. salamae]EDX9714647.1 hypothetical protein [Salmonella enterica subsp. salamae]